MDMLKLEFSGELGKGVGPKHVFKSTGCGTDVKSKGALIRAGHGNLKKARTLAKLIEISGVGGQDGKHGNLPKSRKNPGFMKIIGAIK